MGPGRENTTSTNNIKLQFLMLSVLHHKLLFFSPLRTRGQNKLLPPKFYMVPSYLIDKRAPLILGCQGYPFLANENLKICTNRAAT